MHFYFVDKKITSTPLLQFLAKKQQDKRDEKKRKFDDKKKQRDDERHRKRNQVSKNIPESIHEDENKVKRLNYLSISY